MTQPYLPPTIPPDQFGPVIITGREIYDAIIRVSSKVDLLSAQMTAYEQDKLDHEKRIRSIERRMWPLPSVAVLLSAAAVVVAVVVR